MTDLNTAAHKRLRAYPAFTRLVLEEVVGSDALASEADLLRLQKAWLFQGLDDNGNPFRDPEGSGACVIVLAEHSGWSGPNPHNTAEFPKLQMLVYADSTRNEDGSPAIRDAVQKCKHVFKMLHPCFHLPSNQEEDHLWSGMRVHSSLGDSPLTITDVPLTQNLTVRGERTYNIITD